ncbi:unnamed protein product [Phytophthora lilii]|uniref:Unnamed protein product n=1 Tax=Phytophthora lilii TaxID=2077276 RepID=A0A9W6YL20_9STRA|nr:unnamed protein product [Phytophthora lilii]
MFLDKFNFSLVEEHPASLASFTAHYQLHQQTVLAGKNKKKAEFRRALLKADQLLHMGSDYVDADLALLEEPTAAETQQRMAEVAHFEDDDASVSLDDAWDDPENGDDKDFKMELPDDKAARKAQKSAKRRKIKADVKDVDEDCDVLLLTPAKPKKKAPAKDAKHRPRKSSRKETDNRAIAIVSPSPSPIDLTETPESEQKKPRDRSNGSGKPPKHKKKKSEGSAAVNGSKSKNSSRSKVLVLEDDEEELQASAKRDSSCEQISDEGSATATDEEASNLVLTPLSSIWTTGVSDSSSSGDGAHMQLAYKQDFVWDDAVFTDDLSIAEKEKAENDRKQAEDVAAHAGRSMGKRQSRSVQQSQIRQNLMTGNLDPHTMVQCAAYRLKDYVQDPNSRSRGGPTLDPPFQVVVHPDAVFVADLHAHLATCEIIGFLGGKWDEVSKTLYIQAAFPCRSLVIDGDDGSTDVEMDPGSEIELRGIIENAQLEVVGWYHSHPAFAPDPSVRDIENQTSYQQLFQRPSTSTDTDKEKKPSEPFVGLIVGTYDTRRSTPVSLFRYFHTRGEKVTGGARREIFMPYEFIPGRRHFRSVLQDEERERTRMFSLYHSVMKHFKLQLTCAKLQLPADIKALPTRSRASPTRVRSQGPVRKRKQSADVAGDKPVKKPRARSKRSSRSHTISSHIDLTGDGTNQTLKPSENRMLPSNGAIKLEKREEAVSPNNSGSADSHDGGASDVEKVESPGGDVTDGTSSSKFVTDDSEYKTHSVEQEVAEVVVDAVESVETAVINGGRRKHSRKAHTPKRLNENPGSSGGDEQRGLTEQASGSSKHSPADGTALNSSLQKVPEPKSSVVGDATTNLAVQVDIKATGGPVTAVAPQSSSAPLSAAKLGVSPAASSGSSGRKRNRKPQKTTKNNNRSGSPVSDGPSPGRSPSPTNPPAQTFYDAFQASGPRISNGGAYEESAHQSNRADCPKPDSMMEVEDVEYIVVKADIGIAETKNEDNRPAEDAAGSVISSPKAGKHDNVINEEVRHFVTSLVENVVDKVARATADVNKLTALDRVMTPMSPLPSSSPVEVHTGSATLTEKESNGDGEKFSVSVGDKETRIHSEGSNNSSGARVSPLLFGSNCDCEDIQTSLQKMATYLDKLKSAQAAKRSETTDKLPTETTLESEPKSEAAESESKNEVSSVEQAHLVALRTKYGAGVSGCAEQVITLVDYYRDFERRTDLNEIWKSRITKLEKIESSLSEYVKFLNIPAALRQDFIKVCMTLVYGQLLVLRILTNR